MTAPVIEAEGLTRQLPGEITVTLVDDASLAVHEGEFVAITGASGSGKSSLLYLLGLLDRPTKGHIWLHGQDASALEEDRLAELRLSTLGFVFQFHFLLPEFTGLENVCCRCGSLAACGGGPSETAPEPAPAAAPVRRHAGTEPALRARRSAGPDAGRAGRARPVRDAARRG